MDSDALQMSGLAKEETGKYIRQLVRIAGTPT